MRIGVVKESAPGETRVALIPESAKKLVDAGLGVIVESGAGSQSFCSDKAYQDAGAVIVRDPAEVYQVAEILVKVRAALRARNRHDVFALRQHPRQRELRRGAALFRGKLLDA